MFAANAGNSIFLHGEVKRSGGNGTDIVNSIARCASDEYLTISGLAVSAQLGAITTASASARLQRTARRVSGKVSVTVTNNGTGAGDLRVTLPVNVAPGHTFFASGRNLTTGQMVQVVIVGNVASVMTPTNAYPIASGQTIEFNVDYEAAALA